MSGWMAPQVPMRTMVRVLGFDFAGLEIDVRKGVEFGHDYVDVVAADTVRESSHPLAMINTGRKGEFAGLPLCLYAFEQGFEHLDSPGIAEDDHRICKFFGLDVDVECRAVGIDDKFRFWYSHDSVLFTFGGTQAGCAAHQQFVSEYCPRSQEIQDGGNYRKYGCKAE